MRCTTATRSASSSASRSRPAPLARRVVLDTNALFLPFTSSLRIEAEVERLVGPIPIVVPDAVRGELRALERRGVPNASAARQLADRFPAVRSRGRGDEAVRAAGRAERGVILTADRALRDRLLAEGTPVLYPRDRDRLTLLGGRPSATVKNRPRVVNDRRRKARTE